MRNPSGNHKKGDSKDTFQTPPYALKPLLPYLSTDAWVWEPACGNCNLLRALTAHGYSHVAGTDIQLSPTQDYFLISGPGDIYEDWHVQITNPPYSRKRAWLQRAFALDKPFALLIQAWFEEWNCSLFHRYDVEILLPLQRINFETPQGYGSGAFFKTMWVTWQLGIGQQITYMDLDPEREEYEAQARAEGRRINIK